MERDAEKRLMLSLKKELKCWESMFQRKHDRKPSKTDIEKSPAEIQDAYRQYRQLKSKQMNTDDTMNGTALQSETTPTDSRTEEVVFGAYLNKPAKRKEVETALTENNERKSVWKLRRWTKDRGYVTVKNTSGGVIGKGIDSVRSRGGDSVRGDVRSGVDGVQSGTGLEDNATEANEQAQDTLNSSQLDDELRTLSQELNVTTQIRNSSKCPPKPVVSGECQNMLLAQRGGRKAFRLKHTTKISTQWLGRCRPELEVDKEECDPALGDATNELEEVLTEKDETREIDVSLQADHPISAVLDIDDDFTTWSGDDMRGSSDSSDEEDPVIEGGSAELRWSELSTARFVSTCSASKTVEEKTGPPQLSSVVNSNTDGECSGGSKAEPNGRGGHCTYSSEPALNSDPLHSKDSGITESADSVMPKSALNKLESMSSSSLSASMHVHLISRPRHTPKQWRFHRDSPTDCQLLKPKELDHLKKPSNSINSSKSDNGALATFADSASTSESVHSVQVKPANTTESASDELDSFESEFTEAEFAEFERIEAELPPPSPSRPEPLEDCSPVPESTESGGTSADKTSKTAPAKPKPSSRSSSSSGAVSDNFVRLNMKVKRFSRKRGLTGSAYKRLAWKKMQKSRSDSSGSGSGLGKGGRSVCYKCGNPGHWAKNCDAHIGSKNLGKFDGEKVGFSDKMATGEEEEIDEATLEQLANDSPFPSMEDAALMACGIKFGGRKEVESTTPAGGPSLSDGFGTSDGDSTDGSRPFIPPPPNRSQPVARSRSIQPLFPTVDGMMTATPTSVYSALRKFGYDSFRAGQEEAVMRVLCGVSTLVINSTGSGKSLCYQLPAFLYSQSSTCLALVISPLVSLMEDQVRHFPTGVNGGCLHTSQTRPQRDRVLKDAVEGKLNVLLLSPEALVGGALWSKSGGGAYSLSQLPPVAFACIDEAHCVSEWSHNFRPSYLRVYKLCPYAHLQVLKERLGVYCVLALTATATYQTAVSVATNLGIESDNIIRGPTLPDNLHISVSCDQDRDQGLVELLQSPTFRCLDSIIIYCTRQQETERVAQLLRTCLVTIPSSGMGAGNMMEEEEIVAISKNRKRKSRTTTGSKKGSKRPKIDWSAECYHAGLQASRRRKVQSDFMSGRLRIVVATVAFGMGLNKSDVRAIIHYNLPKSFESFVQEIGRAGRDGLPAYCHVFIDKLGNDLAELRRHAYGNTVERYGIKQLVSRAFPSCQCRQQKQRSAGELATHPDSENSSPPRMSHPRWCNGHEVAVPIDAMVTSLDVKEECVSTLLCYLELEDWLDVLNPINDSCTLKCYNGAKQLRALAGKVPAVAAATARLREKGTELSQSSAITFSVTEVADSMGWDSHIVRSELSGLMINDRGTGGPNTTASSVLVEFGALSFHFRALGDLTPEERDAVCDFLYSKVKGQEERQVEKLHLFHAVLSSVACQTHEECFQDEEVMAEKLNTLNKMIKQYFSKDGLNTSHLEEMHIPILSTQSALSPEREKRVCDDINTLVSIHSEHQFTGRAIARIFHGIASPLFEAVVWGGQRRFWRRHMDVDFNLLCQLATKELLNFR